MIEKLRVRILAGASGEFSSPELTFVCSLLFGVRFTPMLHAVAREKTPAILPKVQVAGYT